MRGDRQRHRNNAVRQGVYNTGMIPRLVLGGLTALLMYPGDGLAAIWPVNRQLEQSEWTLRTGTAYQKDLVLPFRAGPRTRTEAQTEVRWNPSPLVQLDGQWGWVWDQMPAGQTVSGAGDIRLGVHAVAWSGPVDLGVAWQVKLPNARDESELGSDETDSIVAGTIRWFNEYWSLQGTGGVVISGDPIRFANQDDAALMRLHLYAKHGGVLWGTHVGGTLSSPRNPARMTVDFEGEKGCRYRVGGRGTVGLTPAAPAWGVYGWVGFGPSCD
jgi:hypothetical protein